MFFLLDDVIGQHFDEFGGYVLIAVEQGKEVFLRDDAQFRRLHGGGRFGIGGTFDQVDVAEEISFFQHFQDELLAFLVGLVDLDLALVDEEDLPGVFALVENHFLFLERFGRPVFRELFQRFEAAGFVDEAVEALGGLVEALPQPVVFPQAGFEGVEQFHIVEGLGDVVVGPQVHAFAKVRFFGLGRQEDEGNVGCFRLLAQDVEHAKAVEFGHHDIAEDEVGFFAQGDVDPFLAVFGCQHLVVRQFQDLCQVVSDLGIILNDQNTFHRSG